MAKRIEEKKELYGQVDCLGRNSRHFINGESICGKTFG